MTKTEWNKFYKDHPKECADVSVYELKMVLAYKQELQSITRWDVWLDDYFDELKERHQLYVMELGREADEKERAEEAN